MCTSYSLKVKNKTSNNTPVTRVTRAIRATTLEKHKGITYDEMYKMNYNEAEEKTVKLLDNTNFDEA